jgi:PAS domain S-box-containing protein
MKPVVQEKILNAIIEVTHDGIFLLDSCGVIISANPVACSLCGFESENDLLQQPRKFNDLFNFYDHNDKEVPLEQLPVSRALNGENVIDYKGKGISKKTGKIWYGLYSAVSMSNETRDSVSVALSIKDISGSTVENENTYQLALMIGSYGVYDFDIPAGRAKVNPEYEIMLEYTPGEVLVTFDWWINSIHPEDRERARSTITDCAYGKSQEYKMEFRMRTKSGTWKWVLCQGKNIEYDLQGKPIRMLGTHIDIAEHKRVEEALREERNKFTKIAASVPGVICSFRQRPD